MATVEHNGLMTYKDEDGNLNLMYPITKQELVDGLEDALAGKEAAGAADAVQVNLNTHDGNTTKHITAAERTSWNGKAAGSHSHSAADLTSGTLSSARLPANLAAELGVGYGTCSTAAATTAKTVSITGFKLVKGAVIGVKFSYANTAASPTLNVNATGARTIYHCRTNASPKDTLGAQTHYFVYNGTQWVLLNPADYSYGTDDLTAGTSALTTGKLHFVYE